jgi:hypothetical protein
VDLDSCSCLALRLAHSQLDFDVFLCCCAVVSGGELHGPSTMHVQLLPRC